MGVDKRGVTRGKCTECESEEFESVSSIVCEYCGHPPVKHERQNEVLSPPTKKRCVPVSNNTSQPFYHSAPVTSDPLRSVPDPSPAVVISTGAFSGLLEQGCDSAHAISDSVVTAGLSEEVCDESHSASDPAVPIPDSEAAVSDDSLIIASTNSQTSSEYSLATKNVISFLKKISEEEGDLSTPVSRYQLTTTEEGKRKVTCEVCKKDVLVGDTSTVVYKI